MSISQKALLSLSVILLASQVQASSYNESCTDNGEAGTSCDSKKFLSCQDNLCRCLKPEDMTFDVTQDKCIVLAGKRCSYYGDDFLIEGKPWSGRLPCVGNSTCIGDGYCDCDHRKFFQNPEGRCSPKVEQGGNCTMDKDCLSQFCDGGICSCNSTEAVYDSSKGKCVGIVGAPCKNYGYDCVQKAFCYGRDSHYSYGRVGDEKCRCEDSFVTSKQGLCVAGYNRPCDTQAGSPCSEHYACLDGKCKCPFPSFQYGQEAWTNSPCVSKVGGPCREKVEGANEEFTEFPCVGNATCKSAPHGISECQCEDGYIESAERECRFAHGHPCKSTGDCDTTGNLVCRNGKCSCNDFEIYDKGTTRCRGLVGAQCNQQTEALRSRYCVDGAFCDDFRGLGVGRWTCRCEENSTPTTERKCVPVVTDL